MIPAEGRPLSLHQVYYSVAGLNQRLPGADPPSERCRRRMAPGRARARPSPRV